MYQWSAYSILEEFAEQRGFHTAKSAGPDVHRAANTILRFTAEGRILLSFKPPGFFTSISQSVSSKETNEKELL